MSVLQRECYQEKLGGGQESGVEKKENISRDKVPKV